MKNKLRSREAYQDFLKCLNLYAQEVISKSELTHLVHDLIGRYSDLAVRICIKVLMVCSASCAFGPLICIVAVLANFLPLLTCCCPV